MIGPPRTNHGLRSFVVPPSGGGRGRGERSGLPLRLGRWVSSFSKLVSTLFRQKAGLRTLWIDTLSLGLVSTLILASCAKPPNRYDSADLAFDYPHAWHVEFDERQGEIHVVTLDAAAEMMVSVSVFPAGTISLENYVEAQQQSFSEGVPAGAFRHLSQESLTLAGRPAVEVHYSVGPGKLRRSRFVSFETGGREAFAFLDVPESGFAAASSGFQQLLESLELKTQPQP